MKTCCSLFVLQLLTLGCQEAFALGLPCAEENYQAVSESENLEDLNQSALPVYAQNQGETGIVPSL